MLWLDIIDIIYLLVGVLLGYIICAGITKDECEECEYREFVERLINERE